MQESESNPLQPPSAPTASSSRVGKQKAQRPKKQQAQPAKPIPTPYIPATSDPSLEESQAVHEVYEAIAPHFSQTRSKPWPLIERFLRSLPPNTIGLDSGAGNGKYLPIACEGGGKFCVALDRSSGLLGIAKGQVESGGECLRGDLGFSGWREGVFDWAISVAAIHHLSTDQRRMEAVQELIRPLILNSVPPYSRFVIYVWAYEQGEGSKRKMGIISDTQTSPQPPSDLTAIPNSTDLNLNTDSAAAATMFTTHLDPSSSIPTTPVDRPKYQPSQNLPTPPDRPTTKIQDVLVPWVYKSQYQPTPPSRGELRKEQEEPKVFRRYYHLFVEGELRGLVERGGRGMGFGVVDGEEEGDAGGGGGGKGRGGGQSGESDGIGRGRGGEEDARDKENGENTDEKWLKVLGVGWEADNWWLEGEVGIGLRD